MKCRTVHLLMIVLNFVIPLLVKHLLTFHVDNTMQRCFRHVLYLSLCYQVDWSDLYYCYLWSRCSCFHCDVCYFSVCNIEFISLSDIQSNFITDNGQCIWSNFYCVPPSILRLFRLFAELNKCWHTVFMNIYCFIFVYWKLDAIPNFLLIFCSL